VTDDAGNRNNLLKARSAQNIETEERDELEANDSEMEHKEEFSSELPRDSLANIEVRRMSSTPIQEVAETAAEVADTAEALDADKVVALQSES
jgi:hypothetical protein